MEPAVLVAVPDWGLGHASRSLVLIRRLMAMDIPVHLASSGRAEALLRAEYPNIPRLELPGYRIRYGSRLLAWELFRQAPSLAFRVRAEHRLLAAYLNTHPIRAVISDNALGCSSRSVPSAYMTHQLDIRYPAAPALAAWANTIHHRYIARYDQCWVPDESAPRGLAGDLSLPPSSLSVPVHYVGPLSRFRPLPVARRWDVVAVLSGPEPQRSRLEDLLMAQLPESPARSLLVLGKTDRPRESGRLGNTYWVSWLPGAALNIEMAAAELVLCRSGYSSLMDLAALGKPALLIPTPGQSEQEYLADYWSGRWGYASAAQDVFRWRELWQRQPWKACRPPGLKESQRNTMLDRVLLPFLRECGFSV